MKKCPNCGYERFITVAHVIQKWLVDKDGDFEEVVSEWIEVTHKPNDYNVWPCFHCGYAGGGYQFNVKE